MPALLATTPFNAALPGRAVVTPQRLTPPSPLDATVPAPDFDAALRGVVPPCDGMNPADGLQDIAGDGKELPASEADEAGPLIVWIPCELQVVPALPSPMAVACGPQPQVFSWQAVATGLAEAGVTLQGTGSEIVELHKAVLLQAQPVASRRASTASLTTSAPENAPPEPPIALRERLDRALTAAAPATAPTPQLISLPPQSSVALPSLTVSHDSAGHVFVSALSTTAPDSLPPEGGALLSSHFAIEQLQTVPAIAGASQGMLDLSRQDWGAKIIERPATGVTFAEAGVALHDAGSESAEMPRAVLLRSRPMALRQISPANLTASATEDTRAELLIAPRERFDRALTAVTPTTAPTPQLIALPPQSTVALAPPTVGDGVAGQVFASALSTAGAALESAPPEAGLLLSGSAAIEQRQAVQAMAGASQDMLDLSRQDWGAKMIERIATLRDSAEIADMRIKLAPENLGALEISVRRDGDRIHVHFAAENAAARQLIAEATPRLSELAEARGLKLGQTSVDSGAQQGTPRDTPQRQANGPARNAGASARRDASQSDHRIA